MVLIIKFIYRYVVQRIILKIMQDLLRLRNMESYIDSKAIIKVGKGCSFSIGDNSSINSYTYLVVSSQNKRKARLIIGNNTYIGEFNNIRVAGGEIIIGDNCLISQHITMISSNHEYSIHESINKQKWNTFNNFIHIKDGVWVGANVVILPGITINEGAIIGAGSIVTKDVPQNAIVVGNPAIIKKYRF